MKANERKIIAEINITPLTDIFLVLLIIMMVVTPLLDFTGLSTALGSSDAPAAEPSDDKALTVEITASGPYKIDGKEVAPEAIADKIKSEAPSHKAGLLLEVDPTAPLERLTRVMDVCQANGISDLSISEAKPAEVGPADPQPAPSPKKK
jgi:biopolymer transport protein ExbD/biopolymer transport protein TolR